MVDFLFKQGDFEILADNVGALMPPAMNQLVKKCGCVSHQSFEVSTKTPEEFIGALIEMKHWSVLEHSWFTFQIKVKNKYKQRDLELELLQSNHLFCLDEVDQSIFISGNSRMFNEAYLRNKDSEIINNLMVYLSNYNSVLFPIKTIYWLPTNRYSLIFNPTFSNKSLILHHRAMTVLFNNVSRGFTHEDVRSRNGHNKVASYTQESTRYVNPMRKGGFKFILPYQEIDVTQKINLDTGEETIASFTSKIEKMYVALIALGLKAEEARQWLPIGIKSQIVQTFNLDEWRHWFFIRTQKAAHPEIRFVACNLLQEVQSRLPQIFDDFEIQVDKNNSNFTIYQGQESIELI